MGRGFHVTLSPLSANYFIQFLPSKGLALTKMLPMQAQNNDRGCWISNAYFFGLGNTFQRIDGEFQKTSIDHKALGVREWEQSA